MSLTSGLRADTDTRVILGEGERLRPLRDWIVLEPLDWQPSKIINVVYRGGHLRGIVRAIGPGRYPLKYDGPKGKRSRSWLGNRFQPTSLQVGDIVELGALPDFESNATRGYLHPIVMVDGKEMLMCREGDVAMVVEDEAVA